MLPRSNDSGGRNLRGLLDRLRQGSQVVLLGDFNLHLHKASGDRVGDLHWHTQHPPPEIFWDLLDTMDLWIPSTFSCCHPGPSETWRSPNGNATSRLDYVAIPSHWQVPAGGSSVVPELDWGQSRADHYALLVYTLFNIRLCPPKTGRNIRLDTRAMRTPEGREKVRQICAALPEQPWSLDVHRHAARIEEHFRRHLPISFPAPRARQLKPHFHPETWQLRCHRAWQRKRVYVAGHFCHQVSLRLLWRRPECCEPRHRPGRIWARFLRYLRELPDLISSLRESSTTLRSLVRRDTQAYLHEVAVQAATDPTNCVVQKLRQLTGGPKRKQRGSTPLPAVETSDGQLAKTHAEAKARWIEHFAAIEDGQVQDPTAFVHACYQRQSDKDLSMHMLTAEDIPSLAELEASLRATSTDRAYGLDDIPGEVIRYGAAEISKSVYALLLKSIFRLTEPVQHKGGTLHCIWKGKGPKQICGSYRGILVSSMLGKSLHKTLRGRCSDTLASSTVPLQVGGLPRFPVTVPAQAARLFQSACHRHGRPYTLLFLDLQEAFYRIIRPLITGDSLSDEQVAHVCSAVQLPAGTMHELHAFLGGAPILSEAGANTWTSGAVSETLHDTWFRLPQEEDVVVTHTGSRPGDSLSDLVFSFLFAKVLTQVRNSLRDAGAIAHIPWCEEMDNNIGPLEAVPDSSLGVSDATWMDDLVMFLTSKDAPSLLRDLQVGASTLLDACLQRALVPNLTRGKTEAIVHVLGPGARKVRSEIFGPQGGSIPLHCKLWQDARLRVVPVYRHLGGYLQHNGGLRQEIAFRTSQAWDAFNKRKKKLFQSPLVSASDKSVFFNSLISTVLFHGAGTWTSITEQHITSIETTLRHMACQMLRPQFSADEAWHFGTMQALARAGIPKANTYLHVARLRHLLACIQLHVPELWALAHWEGHWLESVRCSVQWLWDVLDGGRQYTDWRKAWIDWREDCSNRPGRWKARIRRALSTALQRERWYATLEQHSGLLARQLRLCGASVPQAPEPSSPPREVCALCNAVFRDYRAWSVHAFKRHGRTEEIRSLADGLQCQCCLKHFATNIRLCRHLRSRRALLGNLHRVSPLPGIGSRKAPKEHLYCAPTLQAAGPRPLVDGVFIEDELDRPAAEVLDCLAHLDFDGPDQPLDTTVIWERIRQAFSCVCLPARRLRLTARVWLAQLERHSPVGDERPSLHASLLQAAQWVVSADFAAWLAPAPVARTVQVPTLLHSGSRLRLLDFADVTLPEPEAWTADHVLVCIGPWPLQGLEADAVPDPIIYPHTVSLASLAEGKELDFFGDIPPETGFVINLCGLTASFADVCGRFPHFEEALTALRLSCDLVRLALRLWTFGIRTCLHLPWPGGEDTSFLRRIEGIQCQQGEDRATFWVGQLNPPLCLFHRV